MVRSNIDFTYRQLNFVQHALNKDTIASATTAQNAAGERRNWLISASAATPSCSVVLVSGMKKLYRVICNLNCKNYGGKIFCFKWLFLCVSQTWPYFCCTQRRSTFTVPLLLSKPLRSTLRRTHSLVHMVYGFMNGSNSLQAKNTDLITHLWQTQGGSCDSQHTHHVGHRLRRNCPWNQKNLWDSGAPVGRSRLHHVSLQDKSTSPEITGYFSNISPSQNENTRLNVQSRKIIPALHAYWRVITHV